MNINRWLSWSLVCGLALPYAGGCLRRKESITIPKDGTIRMSLVFEGDRADFEDGDAMPSLAGGWKVTRAVEKKDNGEESHELRATRTLPAGSTLPDSYALAEDPDADLYLHFPTSYSREVREDGVYHIFHRTYPEREWYHVKYWEDAFIDDHHRELAEKPIDELTEGERRTLFEAFAAFEAHKQLELAQQALRESLPGLPVTAGLWAREALLDTYEHADLDSIGERCISPADPDAQAACFEAETERLRARAHAAFRDVLSSKAALRRRELAAFDEATDRAWKRYDLTEQLAGHMFEITVRMPGELVAHNCYRIDESGAFVEAVWEFDGRAFRDRTHELILITREPLEDMTEDEGASDDR